MANSPLRANTSANISKENANDSGELELSDSQGDEIVSNPGAKTPVWKLFGFPGNGNGAPRTKGKVVCRLCRKEMPYKNNTTNLYVHLERHHKEEHTKLRPTISSQSDKDPETPMKQSTMPERLRKLQPLDKTTTRYKQLVSAMVQFISQDMQPIAVVDGSGFRNLMAVAEPRFVVPSRTYFMQTEIPRLYADIKQKVQSVVSSAPFHCITTDMWTSQHQVKGYLTLTTHFIDSEWALHSFVLATLEVPMEHTAENIGKVMTDVLFEYDISEKIIAATTDNGTNVIKAVNQLNFLHMPCVGHTLNLAVKKCFELSQVSKALARIRKLVGHFHRSTKAMSNLSEKQKLLGIKSHHLINDCVTRWGSTYSMLTRFIEQQQAICAVMLEGSSRDDRHLMPTDAEISVAEELIVVLKAFHDATEIISGEKYPTIGIVKPLLKKLEVTLATREDDSSLVKQIKGVIQKDIGQRYQGEDISTLLKVAMFLEPRFKEMPFLNRAEKHQVKEIVKFELQRFIEQTVELHAEDAPTTLPESEPSHPPAKKKKLELFFEDIMHSSSREGEADASIEGVANAEVDRYIAESPEKLDCKNPLTWWKSRDSCYKYLPLLAQKVLSVTATSVASERIFSTAGNIINEKRSRLTPENVNKLIFLHENMNRLH